MALSNNANTNSSKFTEGLTYDSKLLKSSYGAPPENSVMNLVNSDRRLLEMRKKFRVRTVNLIHTVFVSIYPEK